MTMTIDFAQLHSLFVVVLPALVGIIAGLIRQDKLPNWLNELILYVIVVLVALSQALLDGKLGGNALADFLLVGGYCTAFLNSIPGKQLLNTVQTHTSIGGKVTPPLQASQSQQNKAQVTQSPAYNPGSPVPQNFNPTSNQGYVNFTAPPAASATQPPAYYDLATQQVQSVPTGGQWSQSPTVGQGG